MNVADGMKPFGFNLDAPCRNCFITYAQLGLEYPDGTPANANTGMWMHHIVVHNPSRPGVVCSAKPEIVFGSGNERTPTNFCNDGFGSFFSSVKGALLLTFCRSSVKAGYRVSNDTSLYVDGELMNQATVAREAVVTIDWEYVPDTPGFEEARAIWLDAAGLCDPSTLLFDVISQPWGSCAKKNLSRTRGD